MVLGASSMGNQVATALALHLASKQVDIVTVDSLDDAEPNEGDILICDHAPTPNERQLAVLGLPISSLLDVAGTVELPERDNSFRGGSRGKGGKIKYRRK